MVAKARNTLEYYSKGINMDNCGFGNKSYVTRYLLPVCGLVLPLLSIWFLCYAINNSWELISFAMAFNALCLTMAASAFCRNITYRIIILCAALFVSILCHYIWYPVQLFIIFTFAGILAINIMPKHWNKRAWLILPYILLRGIIAFFSAPLLSVMFNITDGESLNGRYLSLLLYMYSFLGLVLIYDLIVNFIRKETQLISATGNESP